MGPAVHSSQAVFKPREWSSWLPPSEGPASAWNKQRLKHLKMRKLTNCRRASCQRQLGRAQACGESDSHLISELTLQGPKAASCQPVCLITTSNLSKESTCNAGDPGLIPGPVRSPGGGHGNRLQYSCLENPMDKGAWLAIVYGIEKSWTQLNN